MAKGSNQKLKLYYLMKIMQERTDDEHGLTMKEIIEALEGYEVSAERKSIYTDFDVMTRLGMEVIGEPSGKVYVYHLASRPFELAELKLLVDAISSSRFITEKKTNKIIKKLESLVSIYEARELQRQVYVSGRIKTMNESVMYTVDAIHNAIADNKKIRFQYFQWNVKKEEELRHQGRYYCISPWGLMWDDEKYYMIGFDSEQNKIKHYRVDKMIHIRSTGEEREGKELFKNCDMAEYTKKSFGMYGGREETVRLLVKNELANVIIDRFGKEIIMIPKDEEYFTVNVNVRVSRQFFSWVFALGPGAKIIGPESVVEEVKKEVKRLAEQYEK